MVKISYLTDTAKDNVFLASPIHSMISIPSKCKVTEYFLKTRFNLKQICIRDKRFLSWSREISLTFKSPMREKKKTLAYILNYCHRNK